MSQRKHISLTTKLASALLALGHIPYEDAKEMTAAQIIALYHFDHGILHAFTQNDAFWNLTPRLIAEHRQKSRKDTGIVAKSKRITKKNEEFQRRLLAKTNGDKPQPVRRWPKRAFPKGRKIR